jgi:uncharacterized protein YecT (DUF1311 family)
MKYGLMILSLLTSIVCVLPVYPAEDSCSYCGIWIPFSQKYDSPYSSNDRLTITEQSIALPGCSPAKSTQVFLTDKASYIAPETARLKPLKIIIQIEGSINCASPLPGLSNGTLIEIQLRPRGHANSEELALVLFAPTTLEQLKASYTHQLIPTPPGQKQMMKRPPRPNELGGWWFIREKYDPCGEGEGRGAWICSAIEHKKADEVLNSEWSRLLNVITPDKKKALITTQKKWLKECSVECAKEGVDRGYHPWGLAYETSCLAREKRERSIEFRELNECIRSGKLDCPQLKNKP